MPLTHNSETREDEPQWGGWIDANRSRLPDNAFADDDRGFPHHWVVNGSGEDENGRWTDGDMFLHRGGLNAAWAAAMGARTGERASQEIIDHLSVHRRVLGLEEDGANAGARSESDGGFPSFPAVLSLPHVATRIFNTPLLIEPGKLRLIVAVLARRAEGGRISAQAETGRRRQPQYEIVNGTAIVPVFGSLVHRTTGLDAMSGLTSYQSISDHLSAALEDPQVNRILLEIDSPGGEVGGLAELAGQIRAANQQKPVIAYANPAAASAAYWIGSAANKLYLSPEAAVGSIGVIFLHMDVRSAQEKEGVAITEVFAGSHKVDTSPYRALTREARDQVQGYINAYYEQFVQAVAQQRGLNPQTVRDTEAALYIGGQAVDRGLADGVRTRAEILTEETRPQAEGFRPQGGEQMRLHAAVYPVTAGEQLARRLNQAIDEQTTEERPRSRIIEEMAEEAGISTSTVNQILNGSINCPPLERLEGFSRVLDMPMEELVSAAEDDGCNYNQEDNSQARSDDMKPLASSAALKAAYPKLVKEIETEASTKATADERQRILDIRSIAPRGCEKLAAECMFEKPCSPEAAAKQFLLAQQQQNKVETFHADGPEHVPYSPSADQPEDLEAQALIAAAKQMNAH